MELIQHDKVLPDVQIIRIGKSENIASLAGETSLMPNRVYQDDVVQLALEQSYARIDRSRKSVVDLNNTFSSSIGAIEFSRALLTVSPSRIIRYGDQTAKSHPLEAMDEGEINELIDNFIAAYSEARDTGDEVSVDLIGEALKVVGRYLAEKLGPKASGVLMN